MSVSRSQVRCLRRIGPTGARVDEVRTQAATLASCVRRGWADKSGDALTLTPHGRDVLDAFNLGRGKR